MATTVIGKEELPMPWKSGVVPDIRYGLRQLEDRCEPRW